MRSVKINVWFAEIIYQCYHFYTSISIRVIGIRKKKSPCALEFAAWTVCFYSCLLQNNEKVSTYIREQYKIPRSLLLSEIFPHRTTRLSSPTARIPCLLIILTFNIFNLKTPLLTKPVIPQACP